MNDKLFPNELRSSAQFASSVKELGAKGNGDKDDANAIQSVFDEYTNIYFPSGTYLIGQTIQINNANTRVTFGTNVTIKAINGVKKIFSNISKDNFSLDGAGAVFDLNNTADYLISVTSTVVVNNITIKNIIVSNKAVTTSKWESPIEIRYANGVELESISVSDYGYSNVVGNECYAIGLFFSQKIKARNLRFNNTYIGLLPQECTDLQVENFFMNVKDNGIYTLRGSSELKFKTGVIIAEEGCVLLSDNVTVDDVTFLNCTNKGVTIRESKYSKITKCTFANCKTAIGDDDSTPSSYIDIDGNTIIDCTEYAIHLRRLNYSNISNNNIISNVATLEIIRLSGSTGYNLGNKVKNNTFDDVNKSSAYCIRFTGGDGSQYGEISNNKFIRSNKAINILRTSGTGCINNTISDNTFVDVNTKYEFTSGLNNIVRDFDYTKKGRATLSGDGTALSFTVAHGLSATPTFYQVTAGNSVTGTSEISYVTADSINLTVFFKTAPVTGTSNVVLYWKAEI